MPELPEVETMRRGILPAVGQSIIGVEKPRNRYRPLPIHPDIASLKRRIIGRTISNVRRLGKRVIIDFDSLDSLVIQPKMAGLVSIQDVPSREHVRLVLQLDNGNLSQIIYWDRRGLGTIHLWTSEELAVKLDDRVLGPDALEVSFEEFFNRFSQLRREVKPALLDQKTMAGVGNLYASEILHAAKVHPEKRCDVIKRSEWLRIYEAMHSILELAILYEGSTLSDGTYRNSLNRSGGYQNAHRVYDRSEESCLTCANATIVRIVQAQRSTFYCPRCQRKRPG